MNLQEQISRMKSMMGIQPINEGIFKQSGKLKDLLRKILNKNGSAEQVVSTINPYETKYGKQASNSTVDGIRVNQVSNEQSSGNTQSLQIFCSVSIITDESQPLPSDPNKKSSNVAYIVMFQKTDGNNITDFYEYFKSIYLIDGQQTDEISQMRDKQNFTCFTSTLEGKTGGCSLPQEVRVMILKSFESNKDFAQLQSYLDKIQ